MKTTRLIQRLEPPPAPTEKSKAIAHDKAHKFGGGGGEIKDKDWDDLYNIWSFEYMGAAEFEFGEVPKAIAKMVKEPTLVTWQLDGLVKPVYVIGPATEMHEINERIYACRHNSLPLKEQALFNRALGLVPGLTVKTKGWLELDNGFFFTIDHTMRDGFWKLLQAAKAEANG